MRQLIVSNIMTLDGFFTGPGNNPMVLNMDASFDAENLERMRAAGTILLGRASYELFSSFWPMVADAPEDPANPALSATNREFSRLYRDVKKIVVSDGFEIPQDHPWAATTTVVPVAEAQDAVRREKAEGDGDIVIFGSHILWNSLLAAGLVDELRIMVGPAAIGEGVPLFTGPVNLRRVATQTPEGTDNVLVRYAPDAA